MTCLFVKLSQIMKKYMHICEGYKKAMSVDEDVC